VIGDKAVCYSISLRGMFMMLTLYEADGQMFRKIGVEAKKTTFEKELADWVEEILKYV
jgi:hypothetical protein